MRTVSLHESCRPVSWLICNVRQKMKRPLRVSLEIIGPPLLVLFAIYALIAPDLISRLLYGHVNWQEQLAILTGVCLCAGVPSIICAALMEVAFSRFLSPTSWRAVMLS